MNNITYKNIKEFTEAELKDLFLSVEWSSGKYPEKLVIAMRNYSFVFSAWDDNKLVGLISSMDDGIMTAYIHYLLVNPDYQYKGIGKELIEHVLKTYQSYLRISLIANGNNVGFYENCEFKIDKKGIPMHITSLLK